MTNGLDLAYYRRREAQERAVAESCGDMMTRRLHLELADRYAQLARLMVPNDPPAPPAAA